MSIVKKKINSKPDRVSPGTRSNHHEYDPSHQEFPVLTYDRTRATNVLSFLNEAYNYAVTVVGLVATVIKTGVLYAPTAPSIPESIDGVHPFHIDRDPYGLIRKTYKQNLQNSPNQRTSFERRRYNYSEFCGTIVRDYRKIR
jgi:hypothetical protein